MMNKNLHSSLQSTTPSQAAKPTSGGFKSYFLLLVFMFSSVGVWAQDLVFSENMGIVETPIIINIQSNTFQNSGTLTYTGSADTRYNTFSDYPNASGSRNVFFTNNGKDFQIASINTSQYTELSLSFGVHKSTNSSNGSSLKVEVSSDGNTFTPLTFDALPTGSSTAKWYYRTATGTIPSTNNLRIRFTHNGTTTQYRIDDVKLVGTFTATCTALPTALTSSEISITSATLSWTAASPAPASGYDYYVSTSPTAPTAGTTPTGSTAAGVVTQDLTGLSPNTEYYYWVRSNCGTPKSAWVGSETFTTLCEATNVPYIQDFESVTVPAIPGCTTIENAGLGNDWVTSNEVDGFFDGKFLSYENTNNNDANAWFYTQGINLTAGIQYTLSYEYGSSEIAEQGQGFFENLRVAYGTSNLHLEMTTILAEHENILTEGGKVKPTIEFTPSSTGVYYFGFNAYSTGDHLVLYLDNIEIKEKSCHTWTSSSSVDWFTASNWSETTVPSQTDCVRIDSSPFPVISGSTPAFARNLVVGELGGLTIQQDASLTVTDYLTNATDNEANVVIKSGGSLMQVNKEATNAGDITFERDFMISADRNQYNFIISPLVGQAIQGIYGAPFLAPKVIHYDEAAQYFPNAAPGAYDLGNPAKGYSIREMATMTPNTSLTATLKGVPFNGDATFTLAYTGDGTDEYSGYNLVGNPYASNLNIQQLYDDPINKANIDGTFHFWDNRGNEVIVQQGNQYEGNNYAYYNATSEIGTAAGAPTGDIRIPNGIVRPGTAFMVKALSGKNGEPLTFKNEYRVAANHAGSPEFFGKNDGSKNSSRYWLTLRTPAGMEYMTAVAYFWGGNNELSIDDSSASGSSDDIYTLIDQDQVAIQGRKPFVKSDKVPLGVRLFDMGMYVISLHDKDGVFANGQNIYIRDKVLNETYNLSNADYKFISEAGEFNDRFELIYRPNNLAESATNLAHNSISIDLKDKNIVATSSENKITRVVVYDLNNRPIYQTDNVNALKHSIPTKMYTNQIVIISLETETGEVVNKKFILK